MQLIQGLCIVAATFVLLLSDVVTTTSPSQLFAFAPMLVAAHLFIDTISSPTQVGTYVLTYFFVHRKFDFFVDLPLDNYFGGKPNPSKDKFDRIKTIQLNDISFDEESEDDFEDANNLKR